MGISGYLIPSKCCMSFANYSRTSVHVKLRPCVAPLHVWVQVNVNVLHPVPFLWMELYLHSTVRFHCVVLRYAQNMSSWRCVVKHGNNFASTFTCIPSLGSWWMKYSTSRFGRLCRQTKSSWYRLKSRWAPQTFCTYLEIIFITAVRVDGKTLKYARLDFLPATKIQVAVLNVMTPCSDVVGYQRFRGTSRLTLYHEDGGSHVLWTVGILLHHYTVSQSEDYDVNLQRREYKSRNLCDPRMDKAYLFRQSKRIPKLVRLFLNRNIQHSKTKSDKCKLAVKHTNHSKLILLNTLRGKFCSSVCLH
jgi:hypothetical protein